MNAGVCRSSAQSKCTKVIYIPIYIYISLLYCSIYLLLLLALAVLNRRKKNLKITWKPVRCMHAHGASVCRVHDARKRACRTFRFEALRRRSEFVATLNYEMSVSACVAYYNITIYICSCVFLTKWIRYMVAFEVTACQYSHMRWILLG